MDYQKRMASCAQIVEPFQEEVQRKEITNPKTEGYKDLLPADIVYDEKRRQLAVSCRSLGCVKVFQLDQEGMVGNALCQLNVKGMPRALFLLQQGNRMVVVNEEAMGFPGGMCFYQRDPSGMFHKTAKVCIQGMFMAACREPGKD